MWYLWRDFWYLGHEFAIWGLEKLYTNFSYNDPWYLNWEMKNSPATALLLGHYIPICTEHLVLSSWSRGQAWEPTESPQFTDLRWFSQASAMLKILPGCSEFPGVTAGPPGSFGRAENNLTLTEETACGGGDSRQCKLEARGFSTEWHGEGRRQVSGCTPLLSVSVFRVQAIGTL